MSGLCIIGAGAAGMMAAGAALGYGVPVTLFEKMEYTGKKLGITGKGRCNVTNNTDINGFLENVTKNPRFLYSALGAFSPKDTIELFENLGVKLKTERGSRVFPESDKARDIVEALRRYSSGAKLIKRAVSSVKKTAEGFVVKADKEYLFDAVIIATGGRSYPLTGSDGSGYRLAARLGHTVTELIPSLIPINSPSSLCKRMQGLSLKNTAIKITSEDGKVIYTDFGEMMFTHFGVTGPMILSASAHIRDYIGTPICLHIDLKPALDIKTLDKRLLTDIESGSNKDIINIISGLLPSKMVEPFLDSVGIDARVKANSLTKEMRRAIVDKLKDFDLPLSDFRPIEEAIITSGGVTVKEINPKDMQSKIVDGLYFAGEIIDTDAYTGGFNLQIAFSTGYLAGTSAAEKILYN